MQKAKKTMPSRTGIPPDAQAEILQKLSAETKITSCEIAEILKKHDVCGDMDALQDAYRKRLGQRLLSGIRDENGKREILSTSGGEYVIVDCCNDPQKLKAIQRRIQRVQRFGWNLGRVVGVSAPAAENRLLGQHGKREGSQQQGGKRQKSKKLFHDESSFQSLG